MNTVLHLASTTLAASFGSAVLILLFLALRHWLRRLLPASLIFAFWVLISVLLLVPFRFSTGYSALGFLRGRDLSSRSASQLPEARVSRAEARSIGFTPTLPGAGPSRPAPEPWVSDRTLLLVWGGGALALLALRLFSAWQFHRRLAASARPVPSRVSVLFAASCVRLRLGAGVRICSSTLVANPAVTGLFRPCVLLPEGFTDSLGDTELVAVLAHELSHLKRRDLWALELLQVARAVHWFNPVIWLAVRCSRQDCEHACDEFVLSKNLVKSPEEYGFTLLKAVSLSGPAPMPAMAIGMFENKRQLKQRIQMISVFKPLGLTRTLSGVVMLSLFAAAGLTRQAFAQTAAAEVLKESVTTTAPAGWMKNGTPATLANYVVGVDRTQSHGAAVSAYVKSVVSTKGGFGGMMQSISSEAYLGKRVRFSGWVRTRDVSSGAHLWLRIDGNEPGKSLQFDNMNQRAPKGDTEWTLYSIVLDVPSDAVALAYGIFVQDSGSMWVSELKLEEVGKDEPTTNLLSRLPKAPVNLGFE